MKAAAILPILALAFAGVALAPAGFAQTAPPLAYVQPLSPQSVQAVQDKLRQAGA
jgi:hypothetical protein